MADPLASVGRGQTSPFLTSAATVNTTLDLLRQYRHQQGRGFVGIGAQDDGPLGTSTRVIVRNDTQGAIVPGSIVKLSDRVTDFDGENGLMFVVQPIFKGITPTATTDRFAILEEGADYPGGGDYSYARAVIAGHAVCVVNITDTGHQYATPTAGDNTRLTSASSGPVLILAKMDTGTGNVDCSVLVTQVTPGTSGGGSAVSYVQASLATSYNVTTSWANVGVSVTLPSAGDYFLYGRVNASGILSVTGNGAYICIRLLNTTDSAPVPGSELLVIFLRDATAISACGTAPIAVCTTVAASKVINLQAIYQNAGGATVSSIGISSGGGAGFNGTHIGYLKLS